MTVAPGSVIGIIGGGQLGRMLAMAAAQLGYKCHIYAPDDHSPAAEVSARFTRGAFDDPEALGRFAAEVDVATYEFENIAAAPLAAVTRRVALHPPSVALETAQDRLTEKNFILSHGGRPAPFAPVDDLADLQSALADIGAPAILKTRRFGYDGKGQIRIEHPSEAEAAWDSMKDAQCILEGYVPFDAEFSILLCRSIQGEILLWPTPQNIHNKGILAVSTVPADAALNAAVEQAGILARKVANALDYVGVLTLEFFAMGDQAIFNEMAPRVHNSGHWTIEGALTSQFENHVRAICGLPLGATDLTAVSVEMRNLIGRDVEAWREIIADRTAHLHLYGKEEARDGRKMGHVTRLLSEPRV